MLKLKKDTINRVVFTGTENVTLTAPVYFLFELISDDTKVKKYFTGVDVSSNICRYNEFMVEVTEGAEDLLNSVINLKPNGYYTYNVYQQSSPTNIDVTLTGGLVENGKLYNEGDIKPVKTSYNDNDSNTYIAYQ
tara:strand:- start:355 stop:759 length:405 start_codon:yes stop_codon:yes gene_type:complete